MPLIVIARPESELGPAVPMHEIPGRYVGAVLDTEAMAKAGGKHRFTFSKRPVTVDDHAYYRRAVADGHLAPADEETAKKCGVPFDKKVADEAKAAAEEAAKAKQAAKEAVAKEAAKAAKTNDAPKDSAPNASGKAAAAKE